jgi:hypothetical protein
MKAEIVRFQLSQFSFVLLGGPFSAAWLAVSLSRRAAIRSGAMAISLWREAALKLFC